MPVGNIPLHLYQDYVSMLQSASVIPMSSLTRPGGYSAELSPFRSLAWESATPIVYRFEESTKASSIPCEEVHASSRPLAIIGICHCPSTANLRQAYAHFESAVARYPSAIVHKCYAFEHAFGAGTLEDVSALDDLVMFPLAAPLSDGHTTVSLHLQVVLDAMTVTILMSLESTTRAVLRQHLQMMNDAVASSDSGFGLLSTNIDPQAQEPVIHSTVSLHLPPTSNGSTVRTASGSALPTMMVVDKDKRTGKRMIFRQKKLIGDFSVVVGCFQDALDYYITAIDGLREEEKRSTTGGGDALWLASALEGYVAALYMTMHNTTLKFNAEMVDKASEAISLYAKVRCHGLEARLVRAMGWYYVDVARRATTLKGLADEASWARRLCLEAHDRLLQTFPDASSSAPRLESILDIARQSHAVGFVRTQALYLFEASSILLFRHRHMTTSMTDLQAALLLTQLVVDLCEQHPTWLVLRFYALRQLVVLARKLVDSETLVRHALVLLDVLAACPITVESSPHAISCAWHDQLLKPFSDAMDAPPLRSGLHAKPSIYFAPPASVVDLKKAAAAASLHHASYFKGLPAALSAQASLSTPRILATPRQLMSAVMNPTFAGNNNATTVDPFDVDSTASTAEKTSAASTHEPEVATAATHGRAASYNMTDKSSAAAAPPRLLLHARNHVAQWQQACWILLNEDARCRWTESMLPLTGVLTVHRLALSDAPSCLRPLARVTELVGGEAAAASTFFYNPFQASAPKKVAINTTFPLHDTIALDLTVQNPLELAIVIPRITAWLDDEAASATCFPVAVTLGARASQRLTLQIRPTKPTTKLVVLGCLVHLKQQTLRFALETPIELTVTPPLPQLCVHVDTNSLTSLSLFELECKPMTVHLTNTSGLDVTHLHVQVSLQRRGGHGLATAVLVDTLRLGTNQTTRQQNIRLATAGFTIDCDVSPLQFLETAPLCPHATVAIPMQLVSTQADVVEVKIRTLYSHDAARAMLFRETSTTVLVTCEPAVAVVGLTPHPLDCNSVLADVWNPSPGTAFRVATAGTCRIQVPPLSIHRMSLPTQVDDSVLQWHRLVAGATGDMAPLPKMMLPTWSLRLSIDTSASSIVGVALDTFHTVVLHATTYVPPSPDNSKPASPSAMVAISIDEETPDGRVEARMENVLVAGHLRPRVQGPNATHAFQVMALAHGVFHIRAHVDQEDAELTLYTLE
ncbi:Aste57867_1586 [Aphanomyces stellatus]|uniref:Aste57867_1586 protein n=1 Tax=Aphanomyces stellatus TaxID=120398 RepID=A0A485K872_9STRA|nr:hypothetical protein As57867_001585 [Aphanomyces stellatus]VFT78799.1 Aste57867_1586 [Aphanomyces stellatus]